MARRMFGRSTPRQARTLNLDNPEATRTRIHAVKHGSSSHPNRGRGGSSLQPSPVLAVNTRNEMRRPPI
jgi:hypothetical protein